MPSADSAVASDLELAEPPPLPTNRVVFRAMAAVGGAPADGPTDLGVRVPYDIAPDDRGEVHPETGGMSVSPDSPDHLPRHCKPLFLGGTGRKPIWSIETIVLGGPLRCRLDRATHALVEPRTAMPVDHYIDALRDTRPSWSEWHG